MRFVSPDCSFTRIALVFLLCLLPFQALGQTQILTQHNNVARTGANLNETKLNTSNVNTATFGKLFTRKVDGQVYAQPLYVQGVSIPGLGKRNVLYVATQHDTVYAFDADNSWANSPYWKVSFINPAAGVTTVPYIETTQYTDIDKEIGITGTPVIDPASGTLYVVAKTKETVGTNVRYVQRLHALDISTGAEKLGGPVEIQASANGTSTDNSDGHGHVFFDALHNLQRPGLLLLDGVLYLMFGSHGDNRPYHGWVLAYDAATLKQIAAFCTTPDGYYGGIWQSGQGLTADTDGSLYLSVGNGDFDANTGGRDYGDSVLKLKLDRAAGKFTVLDYFTPYDQANLEAWDADLGVSGPMLIPDTNLVVCGSKLGKLFLLDRNNLGKYHDGDDGQITQSFWAFTWHLHGSPVYWNSPSGPLIYGWSEQDYLKAYKLVNGQLVTMPFAQSAMQVPPGMPGGFLTVSANGSTPGTGILWAATPYAGDANHYTVPGILRAFDASTLQELWNSKMLPERDDLGFHGKFVPPTVVNGKVYLATFSNEVAVYGLGKWAATPSIAVDKSQFPYTVTISCTTPNATIRYTTDGRDPTSASPIYSNPLSISTCTQIKARAYRSDLYSSGVASTAVIVESDPGTGDGLRGYYYNGTNLTGKNFVRTDPTVNFVWNEAPPITGVGGDNWSGRWNGWIQARCTAEYTFSTISDDGVRLWVNGKKLIDDWTYHAPTQDNGKITLKAGQLYPVRLEFFQGGGGSQLQLFWSVLGQDMEIIPQTQLYSGNVGTPVVSPNGGVFSTSVDVTITSATPDAEIHYTLNLQTPTLSSPRYTGPLHLTQNTTLKAVAFKTGLNASDTVRVVFTKDAHGLKASYFNSRDLSGTPIVQRDANVDFAWGGNAPTTGIGGSNWSARWEGFVLPLYSETYTFSTVSDDGVRLWVNGQKLIDDWTDHGATTDTGTITLTAGQLVPITLEYYQGGGDSLLHLLWQSASQSQQVIPHQALFAP